MATDIDEVSLQWAQHNVQLNHWEEFITLRQANPDQILYGVLKEGESFDFCMCNPPFFSDMEQTGQNPKVVPIVVDQMELILRYALPPRMN